MSAETHSTNIVIHIITNPAIIFVVAIFSTFLSLLLKRALNVKKELLSLTSVLKNFDKHDIFYRFQELNEFMQSNPYIKDEWSDFSNSLLFKDSVAQKDEEDELYFESTTGLDANVFSTADAAYYFNEESMINHKINHKLLVSGSAVLTGMGPLGTFFYIAVGFAGMDFSTEEATLVSVTRLLTAVDTAALVSITAIGLSLVFLIIEKLIYANFCKKPLYYFQIQINRLFEPISNEKFLIELIKESKKQNNIANNNLKALPSNFKNAIEGSLTNNLAPYLENIIHILNQQKEAASKDIFSKFKK